MEFLFEFMMISTMGLIIAFFCILQYHQETLKLTNEIKNEIVKEIENDESN